MASGVPDGARREELTRLVMAARPAPFWLDRPDAPAPREPLRGDVACDLAVIGGGFSGLWTALLAKEANPGRSVVLIEGNRIGWAASGRNGGFCDASLTHGVMNGLDRHADELELLDRMGRANLDGIEQTIERYDIDCGWERSGGIDVATEPWMVPGLREEYDASVRLGHDVHWLDEGPVRAQVDSPTYRAGLWRRGRMAIVDPARLGWGLARACASAGVRIHENTPITSLGEGPVLTTASGSVRAARVALATSAFPALVRRVRPYILPVYDYVLMTEPLSPSQMDAIGWRNRQGIGDAGNQFHYYRLTADNRILWGGYDAVYYNGGRIRPEQQQREATFEVLARHFVETFPQLEDLRFTHKWGGVIDCCSRFSAFFGTAHGGRLSYAAGYTGLGVGATRFGAKVMLDLLGGERTELTDLKMVRRKPVPFPPEPVRSGVIQLTRWSIGQADRHEGRRNLWLRTLDAVGLGFDS
jgi:glycine/D-amino acid oxidase-like deaminating enzyme